MAILRKLFQFSNLFNSQILSATQSLRNVAPRCSIHTSLCRLDLMEFFDKKKNWGEREVKVGRSWRLEELRIKSNTDLHKLWYILLKEKNMLLTMEHAYKERWETMPNPERLDKVEESMQNVESVVRERNRAYWQLEVGETGERPSRLETAFTGLTYCYRLRQHRIPEEINFKHKAFKNMTNFFGDMKHQKQFLSLYREQKWAEKRKKRARDFTHVCGLMKRFPSMDVAVLKEKYPNVDIELARQSSRTRGHRDNNTA